MIAADYKALLEYSYQMERSGLNECPPDSCEEFLAESIFNFTTYDDEMAKLFGAKAIEVCRAINDRTTFEYIKQPVDYVWFLTMCNLPFFADRIEWGMSIRGAFWGCYPRKDYKVESCGLWSDGEQIIELVVPEAEWPEFIRGMIEFSKDESHQLASGESK